MTGVAPRPAAAPPPNLDLGLQLAAQFLELGGLAVGVAQLDLHLVQVSLHLLPQPDSLVLGPGLSVQRGLHGVHGPLVVAPVGGTKHQPPLHGDTRPGAAVARGAHPIVAIVPALPHSDGPAPHTPQVLELLVLLCQLSVYVSLDLVQLQLDAQRLALLMLQGSLQTAAAVGRGPWGSSPVTPAQSCGEPPQCLAEVAQPP